MKKYIIILAAIMLPLFGCEDDNKDRKFMAFDDLMVLDYLSQNSQYSEWCKLIERAGMSATFRLSTTPMTCFVVNNETLLGYLKTKYDLSSVEELEVEVAKTLVKYHTLPNTTLYLSSFRNGKLADSTASGDYLACLFAYESGEVYLNQESKIISFDKEMVNGIIHELDQVIDPVVETFSDYLVTKKDEDGHLRYSLMNEMVALCHDTTKALLAQLTDENIRGLRCRRTFFVVPDKVYAAAGITTLDQLKAEVGITTNEEIEQYVRYHLLARELYSKDIITRLEYGSVTKSGDGTSSSVTHQLVDNQGIAMETMAANQLILAKDDGVIDIIFNDVAGNGLRFNGTSYNIPLKNGVLHELGGVLKIAHPESMITLVELTDYVNFERISTYRQEGLGKTQTLLEQRDYSPYVTWEATPATKGDAVAYIVFTSGSYNFKGNGFLNGDCLYISPGPVGYVEFVTPPIPKGSYDVSPFYKTTKNSGGKYKVTIDGVPVGSEFTAYTPGYDNYWITKLGTVTFNETKSHKIRVIVGSRQGEMLLDMFIFEPLN